jgi:hypothetical protein
VRVHGVARGGVVSPVAEQMVAAAVAMEAATVSLRAMTAAELHELAMELSKAGKFALAFKVQEMMQVLEAWK